jgi:putative lipoic acid-binding regulatory protein
MNISQSENESLIEYPSAFPIKVMGKRVDGFAQEMTAVILVNAPDFDPVNIEMRTSAGGKYISLTCTINAQSQAQLDAIYRSLTSHPLVSIVL